MSEMHYLLWRSDLTPCVHYHCFLQEIRNITLKGICPAIGKYCSCISCVGRACVHAYNVKINDTNDENNGINHMLEQMSEQVVHSRSGKEMYIVNQITVPLITYSLRSEEICLVIQSVGDVWLSILISLKMIYRRIKKTKEKKKIIYRPSIFYKHYAWVS